MAEYRVEATSLAAIADAIREKTGDSTALSLFEMRDIIKGDLQYPVGNLTILTNGEYDVSDCASVSVEVESGQEPQPGDLLSYDWNEATLTLTVTEQEAESSGEDDPITGEDEPGTGEPNEQENSGEEDDP